MSGCNRARVASRLEEDEVFSLQYGNFEDELNLFDFSAIGTIETSLFMRDGFFYIANGSAKKVMEMNSYGDLLTVFYNEEVNPLPDFARESEATGGRSFNRKAISYPFNRISSLAADSRAYLYVVDSLSKDADGQNAFLSQVVLRFNGNGDFVDYVGQEGINGTPFPYIRNIYVTNNNELVVVCTATDGVWVYWFSSQGYLLYTIPIQKRNVPDPYSESKEDSWLEIENVIPDYTEKKLYVKADYFSAYMDDASRVQSGINYDSTMLYTLNVETGLYEKPLSIPPYSERSRQDFSNDYVELPYDFLGVTETGWFFFIISTDFGFAIQMVQGNGQRVLTRQLSVDRQKNLYYTFTVSNAGILSALLVQGDKAVVDWWRTDTLIQAVIKN